MTTFLEDIRNDAIDIVHRLHRLSSMIQNNNIYNDQFNDQLLSNAKEIHMKYNSLRDLNLAAYNDGSIDEDVYNTIQKECEELKITIVNALKWVMRSKEIGYSRELVSSISEVSSITTKLIDYIKKAISKQSNNDTNQSVEATEQSEKVLDNEKELGDKLNEMHNILIAFNKRFRDFSDKVLDKETSDNAKKFVNISKEILNLIPSSFNLESKKLGDMTAEMLLRIKNVYKEDTESCLSLLHDHIKCFIDYLNHLRRTFIKSKDIEDDIDDVLDKMMDKLDKISISSSQEIKIQSNNSLNSTELSTSAPNSSISNHSPPESNRDNIPPLLLQRSDSEIIPKRNFKHETSRSMNFDKTPSNEHIKQSKASQRYSMYNTQEEVSNIGSFLLSKRKKKTLSQKLAQDELDDLLLKTNQLILISSLENIQLKQQYDVLKNHSLSDFSEEQEKSKKSVLTSLISRIGSSTKLKLKDSSSSKKSVNKRATINTLRIDHIQQNSNNSLNSKQCLSEEIRHVISPLSPRESAELESFDLEKAKENMNEPESEDNIIVSSNDTVICATIPKLVVRMTHENFFDSNFVNHFLLTYRIFLKPIDFLSLLELRWESSSTVNNQDIDNNDSHLLSIRLRVYSVLKMWLEGFYFDFTNEEMQIKLYQFIDKMKKNGMVSASQQLEMILQTKKAEMQKTEFEIPPDSPPSISIPKECNFISDIHPREAARQITLIEQELLTAIQPSELLETNWTKKDKEIKAPNVLAMIRFTNHIVNYIINEILQKTDLRERAMVVNRFVFLAKYLKEINNLNGVMEVLSGLRHASIFRLEKTWCILPDETWKIFFELIHIFEPEGNFKSYRTMFESMQSPKIPYLGRHLSDLLFIEEKYPMVLEKNMINFSKLEASANVLTLIRSSYEVKYNFTPIEIIITYFKNAKEISDKEAYKKSLELEGRKKS